MAENPVFNDNSGSLKTSEHLRAGVYKDLVLLPVALLVFLTDQVTKFLVREFLALRDSIPQDGFFRITHTYNTGSAFGLFQDQNVPLIIASLVGVTVLVMIYYSQRHHTTLLRLSLGLQMGGAVGNLLDRVLLGHVIDFADVGPWPVFNVADASIVTGLTLLGWIYLVGDRRRGAGQATESATGHSVAANPGSAAGLIAKSYSLCPVCGGDMRPAGSTWRCSICGVLESIEEDREGRP